MGLQKHNALIHLIHLTDSPSLQPPQRRPLQSPLPSLICPRKVLFGGHTQILLTDFMCVVPSLMHQSKRSPTHYEREGKLLEASMIDVGRISCTVFRDRPKINFIASTPEVWQKKSGFPEWSLLRDLTLQQRFKAFPQSEKSDRRLWNVNEEMLCPINLQP